MDLLPKAFEFIRLIPTEAPGAPEPLRHSIHDSGEFCFWDDHLREEASCFQAVGSATKPASLRKLGSSVRCEAPPHPRPERSSAVPKGWTHGGSLVEEIESVLTNSTQVLIGTQYSPLKIDIGRQRGISPGTIDCILSMDRSMARLRLWLTPKSCSSQTAILSSSVCWTASDLAGQFGPRQLVLCGPSHAHGVFVRFRSVPGCEEM